MFSCPCLFDLRMEPSCWPDTKRESTSTKGSIEVEGVRDQAGETSAVVVVAAQGHLRVHGQAQAHTGASVHGGGQRIHGEKTPGEPQSEGDEGKISME